MDAAVSQAYIPGCGYPHRKEAWYAHIGTTLLKRLETSFRKSKLSLLKTPCACFTLFGTESTLMSRPFQLHP